MSVEHIPKDPGERTSMGLRPDGVADRRAVAMVAKRRDEPIQRRGQLVRVCIKAEDCQSYVQRMLRAALCP